MRGCLVVCGILVSGLGFGCLWDRDTVAMELKGMPEIQDVIAGRFERNPDLFYEMRIMRLTESGQALSLDEHYDVAVAFDRLGRHDEAIKWIGRLDDELTKVKLTEEGVENYSYKSKANVGTFYVHRGLKEGDEGHEDLKKGLALLEEAVVINPDAHFGREKVQIALVQDRIFEIETGFGSTEVDLTREEIQEGVIGMMVLGNAWESARVWSWLLGTVDRRDGNVADLIVRRIREIDPEFTESRLILPKPLIRGHLQPTLEKGEEVFRLLRENGDEWAKKREEFLMAGLSAGRHPDVDEDFWKGYDEVPRVVIEDNLADRWGWWWSNPANQFMAIFGGLIGGVVGIYVWTNRRRVRD